MKKSTEGLTARFPKFHSSLDKTIDVIFDIIFIGVPSAWLFLSGIPHFLAMLFFGYGSYDDVFYNIFYWLFLFVCSAVPLWVHLLYKAVTAKKY